MSDAPLAPDLPPEQRLPERLGVLHALRGRQREPRANASHPMRIIYRAPRRIAEDLMRLAHTAEGGRRLVTQRRITLAIGM